MSNEKLAKRLARAIAEKYKIVIFKSDKNTLSPITSINDLPARIHEYAKRNNLEIATYDVLADLGEIEIMFRRKEELNE